MILNHPKLLMGIQVVSEKIIQFLFFIVKKGNKAQQQHSSGQNIISLCVRRFLNGINPWSGIKVMVF